MNVPTASQKRLVIVGATGMVGGYALRYALEDSAVGTVASIGRRKIGISHPKLKEVLHPDFVDCSALGEALSAHDAAIFCLGAYTGAVTDTELRTITVDYTVELARVLHASSPGAAFSFLSGKGADPTGRSRISYEYRILDAIRPSLQFPATTKSRFLPSRRKHRHLERHVFRPAS
jgi:nucleoside-diphosphate-sugar epimerase